MQPVDRKALQNEWVLRFWHVGHGDEDSCQSAEFLCVSFNKAGPGRGLKLPMRFAGVSTSIAQKECRDLPDY